MSRFTRLSRRRRRTCARPDGRSGVARWSPIARPSRALPAHRPHFRNRTVTARGPLDPRMHAGQVWAGVRHARAARRLRAESLGSPCVRPDRVLRTRPPPASRSPTPICGAARPTPGMASIVSIISSQMVRISSVIASTGAALRRSTGSGQGRQRRTVTRGPFRALA